MTGGTHDGTAGQAGAGEAQIRRPDDGWGSHSFCQERSGKIWLGVDMKRSFKKRTFVFFCRRLSLSRRAGEVEPPSIEEDEYYLWTVR